jgi:Conjugative transposon protein TcpC
MAGIDQRRARVDVSTKPLWRIRLWLELPRYLLCALSLAGLAASARFAIAPPSPVPARGVARSAFPSPDLAEQAYAQLFARAYLTWEANEPEAHRLALASFVGPGLEADGGLVPPSDGEERVAWTDVVQERVEVEGERTYTIAAQTDTAGLVYLSVGVSRTPDGAVRLAGYPAFVGPPASAPASVEDRPREVVEPALQAVVERALRNYLAASGGELAADLAVGARVSLPAQRLSLEAVQRLTWVPEGADTVNALVQAQDARGVHYTLAYELQMMLFAGRWEVAGIQMEPSA